MSDDVQKVAIDKQGGAVKVRVADESHPQAVTGVVWRYDDKQQPDGWSGPFSSDGPEVDLGQPADIAGKLYGVIGGVVHPEPPDDPPTPYEVTVSVTQDGQTLLSEVPEDGGAGNLGDADAPFTFYFGISP